MIFLTCQMHIDASLLNFQFPDPVYAEIKYATHEAIPFAQVYNIGACPMALREINNMPEFTRQCEAAANHNARVYWKEKAAKADLVDITN